MLQVLDMVWAEFLKDLESVKTAVGVRSLAQLNPDDEFRLEASKPTLHHARPCIYGRADSTGFVGRLWYSPAALQLLLQTLSGAALRPVAMATSKI